MKVTIRRSELVAADACKEGLAYFNSIATKGVLKVTWDVPTQVRFAVEARTWLSWAVANNIVPIFNLVGANLLNANLLNANLGGADLGGADLGGAYLGGANLRGADLRNANLRGADLRNANLRYADLRDADLRDANLYRADLRGANLGGARHNEYTLMPEGWVW